MLLQVENLNKYNVKNKIHTLLTKLLTRLDWLDKILPSTQRALRQETKPMLKCKPNQQINYSPSGINYLGDLQMQAQAVRNNVPALNVHANKRATDKDVPRSNAVEAASKEMTQMVQALQDGANVAEVEAPRIVIRQDVRGHNFVFFVDTEDREAKTIQMFDVSKGVAEKEVVNTEFYKHTKPVENAKEKDKVAEAVVKTFNVPRVILRSRLVKEGSLQRDSEGKVDAKSIDDMKANLLKAVEQFRQAILNA